MENIKDDEKYVRRYSDDFYSNFHEIEAFIGIGLVSIAGGIIYNPACFALLTAPLIVIPIGLGECCKIVREHDAKKKTL